MAGFVIYRGPSELDGAPIVVIAVLPKTKGKNNRKTGAMVQTYILREDVAPTEALRTGDDASICGDCKHRPFIGGACYVVVCQGPTVVFKGLKRGLYPDALDMASIRTIGAGQLVRLGTYGDPAAVPMYVWQSLCQDATGRTGYSHQWANVSLNTRASLARLVMASADTEDEATRARAMGYRTFRVRAEGDRVMPGEFQCPASEEMGKRKLCSECTACDGAERGAQKASATIIVHGTKKNRFINIQAV